MNLIYNTVILIFITVLLISLFVVSAHAISPIENQNELDVLLVREASELGLKGHNLDAEITNEFGISDVTDYGHYYHITLRHSIIPENTITLRHELYHVYDKHGDELRNADNELEMVFTMFLADVEAETYALTGLRL